MCRLFTHWWWSVRKVFWLFLVCILGIWWLVPFVNFVFFSASICLSVFSYLLHCQNKINPTAASTWVSFTIVFSSPISFKYIPSIFFCGGGKNMQRKQTSLSILSVAQKFTLKSLAVKITYLHFFHRYVAC